MKSQPRALGLVLPFMPMLTTFFLVLLGALPRALNSLALMLPAFPLIAIYYWALFRERLMPYWFCFALGLLQDLIQGMTLGTSSLIFVLFRLLVVSQKKSFARETFFAVWVGFALLSILAFTSYWLLLSFNKGELVPWHSAALGWLLTAACYPLLHLLFTRIYKLLPKHTPVKPQGF